MIGFLSIVVPSAIFPVTRSEIVLLGMSNVAAACLRTLTPVAQLPLPPADLLGHTERTGF